GRRRMRPRRRVVYHWRVMADSKPAALQETAAAPFVVATERVKPHAKLIALLALGHLVIDLNQGSIPALLPFLRTAHGLSYAEAAMIVLVGNVGLALGPPVITSLITALSIAGTLGMLVPTVIVGGLIVAVLPHIDRAAVRRAATTASARGVNMPRAMTLLIFLVAIRSWAQLGFTT